MVVSLSFTIVIAASSFDTAYVSKTRDTVTVPNRARDNVRLSSVYRYGTRPMNRITKSTLKLTRFPSLSRVAPEKHEPCEERTLPKLTDEKCFVKVRSPHVPIRSWPSTAERCEMK
ncbi:hypothetical protein CBL_02199 [Carabus blaptoides fortunei]